MSPLVQNLDHLVRDIPAMPVVAQKVMHMLGDPRTNNTALGDTLSSDQSLASRLLQMANSPFFGTRQRIGSVSGAIFILGHVALRSLIITVCTKGLYKHAGLMEQKLWEHALGTATASRLMARKTGVLDSDEALICGLLHDIGQTILSVIYHKEFQAIFMRAYGDSIPRVDMQALEREEFGYTHCEVGMRVITKWRLPNLYARAARRHHAESLEVLEREENPRAVALVAQANLIARRLGLGLREPDKEVDVIQTIYNEMLGLNRQHVLQLIEQTLKTYHNARAQFALET